MKKIKLIIPLIIVLLLCGCSKEKEENEFLFKTYIDKDTCVEYFVSDGAYNRGNVMPKYYVNGTLKINEDCLNGK